MKKRFQPNISWLLFLLILLYLFFLSWELIHRKPISIYEVNTSKISDDTPLYGMILREEQVINTDTDGYINYYQAEGNRVGKGDIVYTVDANGEVSAVLDELRNSDTVNTDKDDIRQVIADYQANFSLSDYSKISDLKFNINNIMFEQNSKSLYSDLNKALKTAGKSKAFSKITARTSGVIAYSTDGYEDISQNDITAEMIYQYNKITKQSVRTNEKVTAGSAAYRLVTNNEWNLIVPLTDDYVSEMQKLSTVRVTVDKDGISFNSPVELFEQDGLHFVKLTTSRFMERYINDRFLRIEFNIKSASGLKIPNSSILSKDHYVLPSQVITKGDGGYGIIKQFTDGSGNRTKQFVSLGNYFIINDNYYVDSSVVSGGEVLLNNQDGSDYIVSSMEPLYGVYCVNQGFCEFRPIDILYQNNEYTIVSDSTDMGLSTYDHIVVDPNNLNDNDFIR